ncbi:histidine--tRNA ligase [Pirellulales bacterium]|nr:histidine--tRNA ligase [Pirellulales bacterium]
MGGKKAKKSGPQAKLPKGFRDLFADYWFARQQMIETLCSVYRQFGFDPLETSSLEYLDALGKHLPEADEPDGGVFALRDDDEQWIALRYDLTAPLARVVAEHRFLPRPFRRYQVGPVWRREKKPGPARFREFYQCDFDSVGADSVAADAEVCAIFVAALEELGLSVDQFVVRVNNRKLLTGLLEVLGIDDAPLRVRVLRSIDKLDDDGFDGVAAVLGPGREDKTGQFNAGLGLEPGMIEKILDFLKCGAPSRSATCDAIDQFVSESEVGREGVAELRKIHDLLEAMQLPSNVVKFDPSIVRGLEYYTGPVFEVELTAEVEIDGKVRKLGSVCGGGRYDSLIERFTGQKVAATGGSVGVDRLLSAVRFLGLSSPPPPGPVIVTVMDRERLSDYQGMARELRAAGVRTELYVGSSGFKGQMKYADRRAAPVVVIAGSDEFAADQITLKDMRRGAELAKAIDDNKQWREEQPAQSTVARSDLAAAVRKIVDRV